MGLNPDWLSHRLASLPLGGCVQSAPDGATRSAQTRLRQAFGILSDHTERVTHLLGQVQEGLQQGGSPCGWTRRRWASWQPTSSSFETQHLADQSSARRPCRYTGM